MTEENSSEWQAQPPPEPAAAEQPEMSEMATLGNIFIEPEATFKDLRKKPRFIIAGLIIALLVTAYSFGIASKFGEAGIRSFITEQINKSPRTDSMTKDQKENAVDLQMTIGKYSRYAIPVIVFIAFAIGGLLYWLGAKAFGGTGTFVQNMAVWVYSGFPPTVVAMIANYIVLLLKSADDIDLATSQSGVVHANLGFFVGKEMPVVSTLLATFDVFAIWGWILAAIGLAAVNRMSKGAAWTLVILTVLIGAGFRVIGAVFSGNPS